MKVNDPSTAGISGVLKSQNTGLGNEGKPVRGGLGVSDKIQLSHLSSVLGALQTESPERVARLDHLSVAIRTGSYGVDPYLVGGSVIRESLSAGFHQAA